MKRGKNKIRLSFAKLVYFLRKNGYDVISAFCDQDHALFMKCVTPKQSEFIVRIPQEYSILLPQGDLFKKTNITASFEPPPTWQSEYLSKVAGEINAISVSSEMLCTSSMDCFFVTEQKEDNHIDKLEKEAERALLSDDEDFISEDNDDLEKAKVKFGVIYALVDLKTLHKDIKKMENTIVDSSKALELYEAKVRERRKEKLLRSLSEIPEHAKKRIEEVQEAEKYSKNQLERLTDILCQSEEMASNSESHKKESLEVMCQKTKEAIRELNVNILKSRDSYNELIETYSNLIEEMKRL